MQCKRTGTALRHNHALFLLASIILSPFQRTLLTQNTRDIMMTIVHNPKHRLTLTILTALNYPAPSA